MCDSQSLRSFNATGEVEHVHMLSQHIGELFNNPLYSDVRLLVESVEFPAHRVVLASRSEYFRALLFGGMRESKTDLVELKDTGSASFSYILKYIYMGRLSLSECKEDCLLDVLGLANRYGFVELQNSISEYLKSILSCRNVCFIYDVANLYNLDSLASTCCSFIDTNATGVMNSEGLATLSKSSLVSLVSRNSFCAEEIDIFRAIQRWHELNPNESVRDFVEYIRLPLMTLDQLLNVVRPSLLVHAEAILDAIQTKNESKLAGLNYRGFLLPEENVATLRHGATVVRGEMKANLLDGDNTSYDLDRGFTRHPIDEGQGNGIIVKLGQQTIINTLRLLLWDRDLRSYSYIIEVSVDEQDWVCVVDHRAYLCRSWQTLRFPARVVRYIKVIGTHNTVNRVFHLVSLECLYSESVVHFYNGLIVPTANVATIEKSACVIEGVSRSRNALINGDVRNYDWDSGYTCHQLGSGAIVVQLSQPYVIGSMRLLLWDLDDRSYSYYIEVSIDHQKWEMVADKRNELCSSWQLLVFEPRPVALIKIIGTYNSANEVFHCVHFECPAPDTEVEKVRPSSRNNTLPPRQGSPQLDVKPTPTTPVPTDDTPS